MFFYKRGLGIKLPRKGWYTIKKKETKKPNHPYKSTKTVPHPPYSPDVGPCDFWLFPKLSGSRYETIEEMKEAVTKVTDTLTQEDFHGAFQKLSERYNKCIAAGGDYFEGDYSFMNVLSIKMPIRRKSGNLLKAPRPIKKRNQETKPPTKV